MPKYWAYLLGFLDFSLVHDSGANWLIIGPENVYLKLERYGVMHIDDAEMVVYLNCYNDFNFVSDNNIWSFEKVQQIYFFNTNNNTK